MLYKNIQLNLSGISNRLCAILFFIDPPCGPTDKYVRIIMSNLKKQSQSVVDFCHMMTAYF